VCVHTIVHNCRTQQHTTGLIIFPLILQGAYKFGKTKFPEFFRFSKPSKHNYKVKTWRN